MRDGAVLNKAKKKWSELMGDALRRCRPEALAYGTCVGKRPNSMGHLECEAQFASLRRCILNFKVSQLDCTAVYASANRALLCDMAASEGSSWSKHHLRWGPR
mmetsp:Transcript_21690/g.56305  ORF Transcript_21690/g.56305 Transcript_21690/m.56305 type:complete len:103 (-) Transcript_21690:2197-2505(-)